MKQKLPVLLAVIAALGLVAYDLRPRADYVYVRIQGPNRTTARDNYRYQPSGHCVQNPSITCHANWSLPVGFIPTVDQPPPAGSTYLSVASNGQYQP